MTKSWIDMSDDERREYHSAASERARIRREKMGKRHAASRGVPGQNLCDAKGWQLRNNDILRLFGDLPRSSSGSIRIPADYEGHVQVQNVTVIVATREEARTRVFGIRRRVIAVCPHCLPERTRYVCAGHLHQHILGSHPEVIGQARVERTAASA